MNKFTQVVKEFWEDEEGLTAVEYAVAGGVVTAGLVLTFGDIGTAASNLLEELSTNITAADTTGTAP